MRITFLIVMLQFLQPVFSQKIIAITFADSDDPSIGNGCAVDQNNIRRFYRRLSSVLKYPIFELPYTNDDFNPENFDKFQTKINSTTEDILIFYNTCHGERSIYDEIDYPQLKLKGEHRSVYNKHNLLSSLPHKNLITIIDACNANLDIAKQEREIYFKIWTPTPSTPITDTERSNVKKLFLQKFDLIITSSQRGVVSITTKEGGSVFTNCFLFAYDYYAKHTDPKLVNFPNILKKTHQETKAESLRIYVNNRVPQIGENKAHYPVWRFVPKVGDSTFIVDEVTDTTTQRYEIIYTKKKLTGLKKWLSGAGLDYRVILKIRNDRKQIDDIVNVTYYFHYTFGRPVDIATDRANDYKYTLDVWGEFLVKADITLKNGTVINISKYLDLN